MRLRHKPWAVEELMKRDHIVIQNPQSIAGKWKSHFGEFKKLHVEVGTGKGQFLKGMGELHPDTLFVGVEKYQSVLYTAMERVEEAGLNNVKLLAEDVSNLSDFFAEGEVDQFYINFTDPWPKSRHEKRRLTYNSFLALYERLLVKEGEVHFKTDNQGLFEYSLHSFSLYGMILNQVSLNLHESGIEGNVMTEYEEKFSKKNMRIYRCEAKYRG
ncbi:tRNA (guanosine(46)-N7)-methyltransferase TrmB [Alkalicoccobacillus porphyridii]|uniref:tRNA (guanine-N(7)-)-methyltransferase n=1 Tax=Alkalicoccobacillus porphyridii TaxID=2597270 RepID=A0A554A327_9BACI|nr:tRNA (guanosine(46)-N7)-methyltransferase TrmB [Alkalicoccobacillus porphyridii]TSB48101.1 tRNA (guanosine(46)-N7)-methyltransferase TrmB [Alkalicoccobacillus porphyridii]